jgi:hypothetical protein
MAAMPDAAMSAHVTESAAIPSATRMPTARPEVTEADRIIKWFGPGAAQPRNWIAAMGSRIPMRSLAAIREA